MCWWKKCHPELTLRSSQAVEAIRASGLCQENISSFYENLEELCTMHEYPPEHIWNCKESGAQVSKFYAFFTLISMQCNKKFQ
jgi:hypothetical protein